MRRLRRRRGLRRPERGQLGEQVPLAGRSDRRGSAHWSLGRPLAHAVLLLHAAPALPRLRTCSRSLCVFSEASLTEAAAQSIGEHEWDLLRAKDPAQHLATRMEILSHFEDCVRRIKEESGVEIIELFGYEYRGHDEGEDAVQLTASPLMSNGAEAVRVVAGRLIKASGFDLKWKRPFVFGGGVQPRLHSLVPTVRATNSPLSAKLRRLRSLAAHVTC